MVAAIDEQAVDRPRDRETERERDSRVESVEGLRKSKQKGQQRKNG